MTLLHNHGANCSCGSPSLTLNTASQYDPTRTSTLRNAFAQDMRRRFNWLNKLIREAIITQDVFGYQDSFSVVSFARKSPLPNGVLPGRKAFAFSSNPEKIEKFMVWFQSQVNSGILQSTQITQVGTALQPQWTNTYIQDSYKRGVIRARYEMGKAGYPVPSLASTGGISASMSTPFHIDRVGILYIRKFQGLQGITAAMDTQVSRILAQGIADGDGPRLLARKLTRTITGPSGDLGITDSIGRYIPARRRAEMLARTEIIRAHHQATIQEYKNWGLEGVKVKAEWNTAGDNRVCPDCQALEARVFTLEQIDGMIPVHPSCRCIALPVDVTDINENT